MDLLDWNVGEIKPSGALLSFLTSPELAFYLPKMAENYRQKVDQWAARHPQWPVTVSFAVSGPEHDQRYICTYTLHDTTTTATTSIEGDEKTSKAAAKEAAARKTFVIFELWERAVSPLHQYPSAD